MPGELIALALSRRIGRLSLCAGLVLAAVTGQVGAAESIAGTDDLLITVKRGDTLLSIAREHLENRDDWRALARANGIAANATRKLGVGMAIRVPAVLRKPVPAQAAVLGAPAELKLPDNGKLTEGSALSTTDQQVIIELEDGTKITVAPASQVKFERLRRYFSDAAIEARMQLERGRVEVDGKPNRKRTLEIRAPYATAAVRGTSFRVGTEGDGNQLSVPRGAVQWGPQTKVDAGFGSSADSTGRTTAPVPLLPPADLGALAATKIERPVARLEFAAVPGAVGYRYEIARDPSFDKLFSSGKVDAPALTLASTQDGRYFVRVRALDAQLIEGQNANAEIEVAARPEPPDPLKPQDRTNLFDDAPQLSWTEPTTAKSYRVQVARDPQFKDIASDSKTQAPAATLDAALRKAPNNTLYWRVATIDAEQQQGPFSTPRSLNWRKGAVPPGVQSTAADQESLSWEGISGMRSRLQIARDAGFTQMIDDIETDQTSYALKKLTPGFYYARVQFTDPDGVTTPFSTAQRFEIVPWLRAGDGTPIGASSGSVRLQAY